MFLRATLTIAVICLFITTAVQSPRAQMPLGEPGRSATYRIADEAVQATSTVETLRVAVGESDTWNGTEGQWLQLDATKKSGARFSVWLLCGAPPASAKPTDAQVLRYLLQEGDARAVEYRHGVTQRPPPDLPSMPAWQRRVALSFSIPRRRNGDY